jgi:DNA polymerase-3 subunit alpha
MPTPFTHLHCHSHYSLLQALPKVKELVKAAKAAGMTSLALTDYGAVYGAIEFYKACVKEEIKPIIGIDAYLAPNLMTDKRPRIDDRPYNIVLLAENKAGYKNILKLATAAALDGFYYRPRIDKQILREHREGLIGLSGGLRGDICKALEMNDWEKAEKLAAEYQEIFGPDNFFLEMVDHPEMDEQVARNQDLKELAKRTGLPLVATKDVHYLKPDDAEPHDLLICIGAGKTIDQDDRKRMTGVDYSFVDGDHMAQAFADCPEAVANTVKIAERCNLELELGKWNFPNFPIPEGYDADSYLKKMSYDGLEEKGMLNDETKERLDYELKIIADKGYSKYFLVVADYMDWARRQGIVVTTRGSAAGSLVGYATNIVSIDPLFFKLPFERFLNPDRPSPPDVDSDLADDRRDEVIQYVKEKYGHDHVAQIGTFGTLGARAAVRDVGRALAMPYDFVDKISKTIPMGSQGFAMTIARALEETPDLKEMYDNDPQVAKLLDLAQKIEGCARHVSVHAAGVLIGDKPLTEYVALQREAGGDKLISQFDMHGVEDAGVLKMDFLGLRNLSILGLAVKLVKQIHDVDIDLQKLDYNDPKAYELLARGETSGVFQLSSSGMTKYVMELKPTTVFDLQAMVALYRPGPMSIIPEFIKRKNDPSKIDYPDPRMEELLRTSLGLLIYQDDIMMTAIKLAGYSWGEADKFRKAMGKKIPAEMAKQEPKFINGCVERGLTKQQARDLWELIKPFAAYGFNKSHSASYASVAYHTAYMKANYPAIFMTAVLTAEAGDTDKTVEVINECGRMGIEVLPPDVNESLDVYTYVDDATIRFGMDAIKNLGSDAIAAIIAERKANGKFESVADLAGRIHDKGFNKKSIEALIKSGAMDSLGERHQLLANLDAIMEYHRKAVKDAQSGQRSIFGAEALDAPAHELALRPVPPATRREKLAWEKELLGLYVSEHPYKEYADFFGELLTTVAATPTEGAGEERGLLRVGGYMSGIKQIVTKKGDNMAFAKLEDMTGSIELVVFPSAYKENSHLLQAEAPVMIEGKYQERDGEHKLICEKVHVMDPDIAPELRERLASYLRKDADRSQSLNTEAETVELRVPATMTKTFVQELQRVIADHPGNRRVVLVAALPDGGEKRVETHSRVAFSGEFIKDVEAVVGKGAVLAHAR